MFCVFGIVKSSRKNCGDESKLISSTALLDLFPFPCDQNVWHIIHLHLVIFLWYINVGKYTIHCMFGMMFSSKTSLKF